MGTWAGTGQALAWTIASDVPSTSPDHGYGTPVEHMGSHGLRIRVVFNVVDPIRNATSHTVSQDAGLSLVHVAVTKDQGTQCVTWHRLDTCMGHTVCRNAMSNQDCKNHAYLECPVATHDPPLPLSVPP